MLRFAWTGIILKMNKAPQSVSMLLSLQSELMGGRKAIALLQAIYGSFGLFYIGMKCQQSGISGKDKWSVLAHLSDGDP